VVKELTTRRIAITGIIAALYTIMTVGLAWMSFESIQFRLAEILNLLAFIDPFYGIGVIIGCFLSNVIASTLGPIDWVVGTFATAVAVFGIAKTKNLFVASLCPVIANTLVSVELTYVFGSPLWYNLVTVAIGEFVVVVCLGFPLFKVLVKNNAIMSFLKNYPSRKAAV
jgi:uncharacterized membrane protein